jgi:hypothetical protein
MLRKIIEVSNEKNTAPAADWGDEWLSYQVFVTKK